MLLTIVIACLIVGLLTVAGAAGFLFVPPGLRARLQPHLISFATGTLLGAAFIALLPHAIELDRSHDVERVSLVILTGMLFLFVLEKFALWRHCHAEHCEVHDSDHGHHGKPGLSGPLVLVGDAIHNFLHGILIAAAFVADVHLGIVTALAISAHEVPQQLANFAVLLHSGFDRRHALVYNVMSSLTIIVGGLLGYLGVVAIASLLPYLLAFAVASCIYIAVGDLIPGLHRRAEPRAAMAQVVMIVFGIGIIYWTHGLLD